MTEIIFGKASLVLDGTGRIVSLKAPDSALLLPKSLPPQPFLQIGVSGQMLAPLRLDAASGSLCFFFENKTFVRLSQADRGSYSVFRVEEVGGEADALVIGPLFSSLASVIGDIVGVVQDDTWAFGIQALNAKTLGGFPVEYGEFVSPYAAKGPVSELSVAPLSYFESAGYAAKVEDEKASLLQLYCENRSRPRIKTILSVQNVPVPPMEACADAEIAGAAFALFLCGKENALDEIGRVEIGEGLPHPVLSNVWAKQSRAAMRSYMIAEFGPEDFASMLRSAKRAGFQNLYHAEPFADWGHFTLRKDCFPQGDDSLSAYCAAAAAQGMHIGLHTLSAFTTTNDAYVTKVPDSRLAVLGGSNLKCALSAEDDTLYVEEAAPFRAVTTLQTVRVGDELIRYTEEKGGCLTGCTRGAFGTTAAAHPAGHVVTLLCDHPYRVFFPNQSLQEAYSRRLGELFAKTGALQISFDGLEGCAATGEDAYSMNRFCLDFWETLGRDALINDASRLNHNLWHMHTRMNWGEPWGAKMREGMLSYRIKNQDFYRRNLFPRMLGWFLIRKADRKFEATPPEDIEWALSMAAGFDAGFALSTSSKVLSANGCTDELLDLINGWEELRLSGAFPENLRERLRDPETEWHLEKASDGYRLYPLSISPPLVCDLLELQPGQPGGADWVLVNPFEAQSYDVRLRVEGNGEISDPAFMTAGGILRFPCTVKGGQYLWYRGGKAYITDRNYRTLLEVAPVGRGIAEAGQQAFSFSCAFSGEEGPEVTVRVFTKGRPDFLGAPRA